ncbi:helix-turn-helix transcriptional regulator [Synechococcus sp. UW140]|uniref:helix-turn-helix domain-containing protein n=1 Tax=Synechococcus sp. UW140 TaxID=368503 RepID=UPI003137C5B7
MSSEYRYIEARQLEAGQEFGRMLRRWRELNSWTQYTAYKWAKEAGFEVMAPSTLSVFENGKAPKPRPESFFALAEVNRRLAAKDFSGVRTRALKDQISQAQPLVDDEGRLWGPADFWSCHLGLVPVPTAYSTPAPPDQPQLEGEEAVRLSEAWRAQLVETAKQHGIGVMEALSSAAKAAPARQRQAFQAVLAGFESYTPEQLEGLWDGEAWLPQRWLEAWSSQAGAS